MDFYVSSEHRINLGGVAASKIQTSPFAWKSLTIHASNTSWTAFGKRATHPVWFGSTTQLKINQEQLTTYSDTSTVRNYFHIIVISRKTQDTDHPRTTLHRLEFQVKALHHHFDDGLRASVGAWAPRFSEYYDCKQYQYLLDISLSSMNAAKISKNLITNLWYQKKQLTRIKQQTKVIIIYCFAFTIHNKILYKTLSL